jgi:hypothetical protein
MRRRDAHGTDGQGESACAGTRGSVLQAPTHVVWSSSDHHWSSVRGRRLTAIDYRTYYHLERYVFEEVSAQHREAGQLAAFDFFCIVIWKANRSKSKIAHRLLAKGFHDLESALAALTRALATAPDDKERMRILIDEWGFRLPMASAILTVLYPESFTVYDMRVFDVLGDFQKAQYRTNFEALWREYQRFIAAVDDAVNRDYDLRDKDRWLWGKSFCQRLEEDLVSQFRNVHDEHARER